MVIYKTTNILDGKIYVGKDCNNNPTYFGSGIWLKRAVKKYGRKNFKKEVLEFCDGSTWIEREKYWIKELDARNPRVGYNIADGGGGIPKPLCGKDNPMFGKRFSEDAKRKMSENRKGCHTGEDNHFYGRKHTVISLLKMSEAHKGQVSAMKGKHHTEDAKRKLSLAVSGEKHPFFGKKRPAVVGLKISESKKGIPRSEETKKKLKEAANAYYKAKREREGFIKGRPCSEETKKKLSEINKGKISPMKGRHHTEEARRKLAIASMGHIPWNKGKSPSEETKKKISDKLKGKPSWNKGIPHSEETKRKLSVVGKGRPAWNMGIPMSEESKAKLSVSQKKANSQE